MSREEHDPQDVRTTRSARRTSQATDRLTSDMSGYGEPINRNWRADRATARSRRVQTMPSSRQEFMLWLQYGGWRIAAAVAAVALLAIVGLIYLSAQTRPLSSAETEPTAELFPQTLPQDLATVTPVISQPTAEIPALGAGGGAQFQVFNTGIEGLFLRPEPNTNNQPLKTLPDGTVVTIIGEDFVGPDRVWKRVRDPQGSEGWVASDYLQPAQ